MTSGTPSEEAQDVEGHMPRIRFEPAEEAQDVEAHGLSARGRTEDAPPAKPGTEGRDEDVEGHRIRFK